MDNPKNIESFDPSLIPLSSLVTFSKLAGKLINNTNNLLLPSDLNIGASAAGNGSLTVNGPTTLGNANISKNIDNKSGTSIVFTNDTVFNTPGKIIFNNKNNNQMVVIDDGLKINGNLNASSNKFNINSSNTLNFNNVSTLATPYINSSSNISVDGTLNTDTFTSTKINTKSISTSSKYTFGKYSWQTSNTANLNYQDTVPLSIDKNGNLTLSGKIITNNMNINGISLNIPTISDNHLNVKSGLITPSVNLINNASKITIPNNTSASSTNFKTNITTTRAQSIHLNAPSYVDVFNVFKSIVNYGSDQGATNILTLTPNLVEFKGSNFSYNINPTNTQHILNLNSTGLTVDNLVVNGSIHVNNGITLNKLYPKKHALYSRSVWWSQPDGSFKTTKTSNNSEPLLRSYPGIFSTTGTQGITNNINSSLPNSFSSGGCCGGWGDYPNSNKGCGSWIGFFNFDSTAEYTAIFINIDYWPYKAVQNGGDCSCCNNTNTTWSYNFQTLIKSIFLNTNDNSVNVYSPNISISGNRYSDGGGGYHMCSNDSFLYTASRVFNFTLGGLPTSGISDNQNLSVESTIGGTSVTGNGHFTYKLLYKKGTHYNVPTTGDATKAPGSITIQFGNCQHMQVSLSIVGYLV
jgi:hypothetical protein